MQKYWIAYGKQQDGTLWHIDGSCPDFDVANQIPPAGGTLIVVPDGFTFDLIVGDPARNVGPRPEVLAYSLWEAAKARRDAIIYGAVDTPVGRFQGNPETRAAISRNAALAQRVEGFSTSWTDADNRSIELGRDELVAIDEAFIAHETAAHEWSKVIRGRILAAEGNVSALFDVDILTGWPTGS